LSGFHHIVFNPAKQNNVKRRHFLLTKLIGDENEQFDSLRLKQKGRHLNVLPSKEKIKRNCILVKTVEEITRYELQLYHVIFGEGEKMWFLRIKVKESQKKGQGCDSFLYV